MMLRAPLLFLLTLTVAVACDRSSNSGFFAFDDFQASPEPDLTPPIESTPAARQYDARKRDQWNLILSRLEELIDRLDLARAGCRRVSPTTSSSSPPSPQDLLDPVQFRQLQTQIETSSEKLKTEIAQLDPLGAQSALFLPARRLNRTIRTVLLSTLEISCGTRAVFDARLRAARRQLQEMRKYLGRL